MQPNQALSAAAQQLFPSSTRKSVARTHHRIHERAQLIKFLEALVEADLTQGGYRVMLDTLARLLRQGRASESVTTDWMAMRLGIGRNTVGTAYGALESAGFLKRVAVKHRGAPTRTRLIGIMEELIDGKIPDELATPLQADAQEPTPADEAPLEPEQAAHGVPVQPADSPERIDEAGQGDEPPTVAEAFKFDPIVYASMVRKVPRECREQAASARSVKDLVVNDAWCLTKAETEHYLRLVAPDAGQPPKRNCTPRVTCPRATVSRPVALALWEALPKLRIKAGSKAAAVALADEIAFQVEKGGLGKDAGPAAGVRAGISLVLKGAWRRPYQYVVDEWSGAVLRGVIAASPDQAGDAQKTVH